jgi:hypothetical protein
MAEDDNIVSSHGRKVEGWKGSKSLSVSFIKALIHSWGQSFHDLVTVQVPLLNTTALGIKFQHEFWRDTDIQTIAVILEVETSIIP